MIKSGNTNSLWSRAQYVLVHMQVAVLSNIFVSQTLDMELEDSSASLDTGNGAMVSGATTGDLCSFPAQNFIWLMFILFQQL